MHFSIFVLYPTFLAYSGSLKKYSLGFLYLVISTGQGIGFIFVFFPFPIYMPLISLSSLVTLARTSSSLLNSSSESWHPWLSSNLSAKAFSLSPVSTFRYFCRCSFSC